MTDRQLSVRPADVLPALPDLRALRAAEDGTTSERPTIAALIADYLVWKSGKSAKPTFQAYTHALRLFAQFLARAGIDAFSEDTDCLPASILERWVLWLRERPNHRTGGALKPTTIAAYLAAVSDLFKYATRRKFVPERFRWAEMSANAAETLGKVPKRSARHDRRIPLLVAFVDALPLEDDATDQARLILLRDRALMHLLLSSGMRREEVVSLNRADVDDGWATSSPITGKGNKERLVFWDAATAAAIRAYLLARGDDLVPVFLSHTNRRGQYVNPRRPVLVRGDQWRLSAQGAWIAVRRYSAMADIPCTPHAFRHAMASAMLNAGASLSLIQDLLGHSSPAVTKQVYALYESRTLREGFDKYNPGLAAQVRELKADAAKRTPASS